MSSYSIFAWQGSIKSWRNQAKYSGMLAAAQQFAAPSHSLLVPIVQNPLWTRQAANYFGFFSFFCILQQYFPDSKGMLNNEKDMTLVRFLRI